MAHQKESADIGERTFQFARDVVRFCLGLPRHPAIRCGLAPPLLRAGTSVGAYMAAAQTAASRVDFSAKTSSAREAIRAAIFWLRLIEATQISDQARIEPLLGEAQQLQRMLTCILRNIQS